MRPGIAVGTVPPDFEGFLQRQHDDYARTLRRRIGELESTWSRIKAGEGDDDTLEILLRMAHTMAGSAGVFGFDALGNEARSLEHRLEALSSTQDAGDAQVDATLANLRMLAGAH